MTATRRARQSSFVRAAALAGVALGAAATACHHEPGPGDDCKPTDIRCVEPHTELACQKGVFVPVPCKGPAGCKEDGKHLACDVTGNAEGDACSTDEEGTAVCIGDLRRITCRAGKQTIDFCRGDKGCKSETGTVRCDQSKGEPSDPCSGQTHACTLDGKAVLACKDGTLAFVANCPGEGGCSIAEGKIDCDLGAKGDDKKKGVAPGR
ncbi:MAG TPA: hypothetical protein VHU80_18775 [Polyangiaceae bacterium]|jgi:hypothetical protein|nr:hypothetical protein [Polyangiaceae bacterium]